MGSKNILLTDTSSWFLQFVKITGLPTHLTTLILLGNTGLLEEDHFKTRCLFLLLLHPRRVHQLETVHNSMIILFVVRFTSCNGRVRTCDEMEIFSVTHIYAYGNIKGVIFNLIIPGKIFHRNNNLVYCAFSTHKLSRWMGTNFSHCSKRSQPSTMARLLCCMQRKHVGQLSTQVYFPMHASVPAPVLDSV